MPSRPFLAGVFLGFGHQVQHLTCACESTLRGCLRANHPGPITRRLSTKASRLDWLVPKTAENVCPESPSGSEGWVAGYLTWKRGGKGW